MAKRPVTVKTCYSASELATMQLPGLPHTREGMQQYAERNKWSAVEAMGRGGKRREYVPAAPVMAMIQTRVAQQLLTLASTDTVPVVRDNKGVQNELPLRNLTDTAHERENARKAVLSVVEHLMEQCPCSKEAAITELRAEAVREPSGHVMKMLQAAHDERGKKSTDPSCVPTARTIKRWFAQDKTANLASRKLSPRHPADAARERESARKMVLSVVEYLMEECHCSREVAITELQAKAVREPDGNVMQMLQAAYDGRGNKGTRPSGIPAVRTIKRWFTQDKANNLAGHNHEIALRSPEDTANTQAIQSVCTL